MTVTERIDGWHSDLPFGTRVLIVEDQLLIAATLCDMIEALGGVPLHAETVEDGLCACSQGDFDVALLDTSLHGRSAAPLARALVQAGKPFMLMSCTGAGLPGLETVRTLAKPFSFDLLTKGLAELRPAAASPLSVRAARVR